MLITIECLFHDKNKAEKTVKKIQNRGIDYEHVNIANIETKDNVSSSVPRGINGSVLQEDASVLNSNSEYIVAPYPGILLATGYYSGLDSGEGLNVFAPYLLNKKEALITLKITSEKENLPELVLLINKQGGKNITILK